MRILIVGAGIGGMTLAALLDRRGVEATVIDRAPSFEHAGYMLGLYSLGYRVLHGLGLYDRFAARSVPADQYEVFGDDGALVKRFDMAPFTDRVGPILSATRPELVEVLRGGMGGARVRFDTPIEGLETRGEEVIAKLGGGAEEAFDLVVGADGIHSRVRAILFGDVPYAHTGWGGWVWWGDATKLAPKTFAEWWGKGRFLGAYPTSRGVGVFAGAKMDGAFEKPGAGRRERLRARFAGLGPIVDGWLDELPADDAEMFFWNLSDVRAPAWTKGRVVLLGDAVAGFLPTAGIGASMAMESAAVLADELSRASADARSLGRALELYVKRRRARVERIQDESRTLAKMMFVRPSFAGLRNFAVRFYSVEGLAKSIARSFDEPI